MVKNIEKNACLFLPGLVQFGPVREEDWKLKVNRSKLLKEDYEKYQFLLIVINQNTEKYTRKNIYLFIDWYTIFH